MKVLERYADANREHRTDAEMEFSRYLMSMGVVFEEQVPIFRGGNENCGYIADFLLPNATIVEIDGGYHKSGQQRKKDRARTKWLRKHGFKVVRYTNQQVFEMTGL